MPVPGERKPSISAKRLVDNTNHPHRRNKKVEIAVQRFDFLGKAEMNGNLAAFDLNLCHGSYLLAASNVLDTGHEAMVQNLARMVPPPFD
jgi:hypothetical protein